MIEKYILSRTKVSFFSAVKSSLLNESGSKGHRRKQKVLACARARAKFEC